MSGSKEKRNLYVLASLTVILLVVGYVRFAHKKGTEQPQAGETGATAAVLNAPRVDFIALEREQQRSAKQRDYEQGPIRDLFAPGNPRLEVADTLAGSKGSRAVASLKLRGIIAGGRDAVALINDRFVRVGDRVDEYSVVNIEQGEVLLVSDMETLTLQMGNRE